MAQESLDDRPIRELRRRSSAHSERPSGRADRGRACWTKEWGSTGPQAGEPARIASSNFHAVRDVVWNWSYRIDVATKSIHGVRKPSPYEARNVAYAAPFPKSTRRGVNDRMRKHLNLRFVQLVEGSARAEFRHPNEAGKILPEHRVLQSVRARVTDNALLVTPAVRQISSSDDFICVQADSASRKRVMAK